MSDPLMTYGKEIARLEGITRDQGARIAELEAALRGLLGAVDASDAANSIWSLSNEVDDLRSVLEKDKPT